MARSTVAAVCLLLLTACSTPDRIAAPTSLRASVSPSASYIVVLRRDANPHAVLASHGVSASHVYESAIVGFSASLDSAALDSLRQNPLVAAIVPDGVMTLSGEQASPTWGLDRIDQRSLPLDYLYGYPEAGSGVTVYDIDSGVREDHIDFAGRIVGGVNFTGATDGVNDCLGHGTHTAGTVAGTQYGVAKLASLVIVRVFDCSRSAPTSTIIAGVDWVATNAHRPAVANMSIGGPLDPVLNTAVANLIASGVTVVVAAGNDATDACSKSPASEPTAITVGAIGPDDTKAYFSNYGGCVDLWAPGLGITSDWIGSATAIATISGTSMATPHVTGAVARILSAYPSLSPAQVADLLARRSTKRGLVDPFLDGDLLYTGTDEMAVPPGARPIASFTASCVFTSCTFTDQSTPSSEIVAWSWSNGATTPTTSEVFHLGAQPGSCCFTQSVGLIVTNSAGLQSKAQQSLALISPIRVSTSAHKAQGVNVIDVTYRGARGDSVTITRQNQSLNPVYVTFRVANTGLFTDALGKGKVPSNSTYAICEMVAVFADWQCTLYER